MKVLARNFSSCPFPSSAVSTHSKGFAQKLSPLISVTNPSAEHGFDLGSDSPFKFMASFGSMGGCVDQCVEKADARLETKGCAKACRTGPVVGLDGTLDARPGAHGVSALHQGGSSLKANPAYRTMLNRPKAEVGNVGTWKGSSEGGDDEDRMESEEGGSAAIPLY